MKPLQQSKFDNLDDDKPPTVVGITTNLLPFYPYWIKETPPSNLKHFYTKNGHLKLIKSLKIEIISSIDRCYNLWQELGNHNNLFDSWEFRFAFWKGYKYTPHFILLKTENENMALLPLWYEADEKRYVWFGSVWQEENLFFAKDPLFVPLLLSICPSPCYLNAISPNAISRIGDFMEFKVDDPKFILDLTSINSLEDFLKKMKKKRRYNLRRDRRIIESQNPEITINNFSDFNALIDLSIKRFAEKGEDTDWEDPRRIESFRQVIELGKLEKSYSVRMLTVKIDNIIAAVDLVAIYNSCYYPLKCGYDIRHFPGIGNYMNLYEIEDAIKLGMKKMDFLEVDYGWKNKWFDEVPLFKYEKDYSSEDSD